MRISAAQRKVSQLGRKKAIAAEDEETLRGPKPQTHSVRMPAYAYTPLCPDPELREVSGGSYQGEEMEE